MAEEGKPRLTFEVTTVIYGGRKLVDHWRLETQNIVKQLPPNPGPRAAWARKHRRG